jgi:pimeloyl-ACP methyl ester carboxylesterase
VSGGLAWDRVTTGRGVSCRVLRGDRPGGTPLVYLHGATGLAEDDPLVARLAAAHPVLAPELPGYGESTGEDLLEDMLDFTLHGWDVVAGCGVERPVLVGHALGGMIAAEMAALCPSDVAGLVLIAPLGLWLDEHPIPDIFATLPHDLPALLFADPEFGAAHLTGGVDFSNTDALIEFFVGNAKRLGTAGKVLFPIPDRRVSKRLYRVRAPSLLVWGAADGYVPLAYADAWAARMPGAEIVVVPDAGHMVTLEQPDAVADVIDGFVARL